MNENSVAAVAGSRAWVVRITGRESLCLEQDTVAVGWSAAEGLDSGELDREAFKKLVREKYHYDSERGLGQAAGSLWRFVRDISEHDWIVTPTWEGLHIARVSGPLIYDKDLVAADSAWRFPVTWIRKSIARSTASAPLQARCASRQTCSDATDLLNEIETLSRGEGKTNLERAIGASEARNAIGKVLDDHLHPTDLEHLVVKLAKKSGAISAERLATNWQGKKGDADVVARFGFAGFPLVSVGFQVKKHFGQSMTDEVAVAQIIQAMADERLGLDLGCVVTTASDLTPAAKKLAEAHQIRVIDRDRLIQWVLSVGIATLE